MSDTMNEKEREEIMASDTREELDARVFTRNNEVYFNGYVTGKSITKFIDELSELIDMLNSTHQNFIAETDHKKSIVYYVNSRGGSLGDLFRFVDFMRMEKFKDDNIEFISVIHGDAFSAGSLMAIAADKRYMTKYSMAMIHELSAYGGYECYTHKDAFQKHLKDSEDQLVELYVNKTGLTKDCIKQMLLENVWFTAQDYLEKGFIDRII